MRARIGYSAWVAGVVQFFAVHWFVESAWARPYSWARNNISDLGNAHCALQSDPEPRYVCSPEHAAMNASFIALGTLLVVGIALTGALWRRGSASTVTRFLLAGAGVGFVLAGLAPADVHENQHVLGALLIMGTGNIGLLLAGARLAENVSGPLRRLRPPCWESPRSRPSGSFSPATISGSAWEAWSESRPFLSWRGHWWSAAVACSPRRPVRRAPRRKCLSRGRPKDNETSGVACSNGYSGRVR